MMGWDGQASCDNGPLVYNYRYMSVWSDLMKMFCKRNVRFWRSGSAATRSRPARTRSRRRAGGSAQCRSEGSTAAETRRRPSRVRFTPRKAIETGLRSFDRRRTFSRKLRELELQTGGGEREGLEAADGADESRAELRARLAEAERLVRRLRADADRQRREVLAEAADGVTNLLFDGAHARQAHVCHARDSPLTVRQGLWWTTAVPV